MSYENLMATVEVRGEADAKQILLVADVEQSRQDNIEIITAITDTIAEGITLKPILSIQLLRLLQRLKQEFVKC